MATRVVSRAAGLGALTAAGQLLVVGSLPAYSRAFDPGPYGKFLIFVGAIAVVGVFAGLRYDSAIVLPRDDGLARRLTVLVMIIAMSLTCVIAAATLLAQTIHLEPDRWMQIDGDVGYGLAVATTLGALQRCLSSWCIRRGHFFLMGFGLFTLSLITVIAQLSLVRIIAPLPALIWGYVLALGCQAACLAMSIRIHHMNWRSAASARGLKVVAHKYRRFPLYMVGYALASSARDRLVQIVLGLGAGAAAVGRFGLAYRVAFAPNSLIYSALSPIFFALASRGSRQAVGKFAAGLVEATFIVMLVPYVAFAAEAPALTDQLLSVKWRGTGPFLQALAGPALILAATCWLDRAFDSFRRQKVAFALEASFTSASVVIVALLSHYVSAVATAWVFGCAGMLYYWIYFLTTFVACGFPMKEFRRACSTGFIGAVAALALGALVHQIPSLPMRVPGYAAAMTITVLWWIRFRAGASVIQLLMRSRVDASAVPESSDKNV